MRLGVSVVDGHDHGSRAAKGTPKAAVNKCLQMVAVPAKVQATNPLRPGHWEIVIKEKASKRTVYCTVPADGGEIEDWVEMN